MLFYHLLWELTHVCFEHSGLLKPECAPKQYVSRAVTRGASVRW